jgi:acetyl-CoA carboxylase biotin carboxyl carrier protein
MNAGRPESEAPEIIDLIDQLEKLLNDSELTELEVEAGQTALVLRKPSAFADAAASPSPAENSDAGPPVERRRPPGTPADAPGPQYSGHIVAAPLTGLFYGSPSPGAEPYVREGGQVSVGQVIGLIEAMKLFNEIKSDAAGRVSRIHAENGALVKARQPLIEIEPI